jgi:hypothetical protein
VSSCVAFFVWLISKNKDDISSESFTVGYIIRFGDVCIVCSVQYTYFLKLFLLFVHFIHRRCVKRKKLTFCNCVDLPQ